MKFHARGAGCKENDRSRNARCNTDRVWVLLNAPPLAAADSEMTQEYSTCMDKSKGNTAEMTDCIRAETARQDARLNENYKRLMSKLAAKRKNMLLKAQRA